jgi:hypothetical protein
MKIFLTLGVAVFFLGGCSVFTPPKEKPVIEDTVGSRIGTLATTAERRVVLVDLNKDHFCAEAAPDVAESVNSSIRAAVEYSSKGTSASERTAQAEIARQLSTSISMLFSRTQGVQLFRDGSYALCQARMNGDVKDKDFQAHLDRLLAHSVELIKLELPLVAQRMAQAAVAQSQSAAADSRAAAGKAEEAASSAAVSAKSAAEVAGAPKN